MRAILLLGAILALSRIAPAPAAGHVVSLNLCTDQLLVLLAPEKVAALSSLARDPALSFVARQAASLPMVRASAEAVLALHPDLVLGARFGARITLDLLERSGTRVERVALPADFPGIRRAVHTTAALLDVPERADPLLAAMDAALAVTPHNPAIRALVWEPRGWTAGPGGLMDAVLHRAGMVNAGGGGRIGLETLLRDSPDLLVVPENDAGASLATEILRHPSVRAIPMRAVPTPLTICAAPFTANAVALLTR